MTIFLLLLIDFDFNAKELCHIHKCQKGESVKGKDLLFAHLLHKLRDTLAHGFCWIDKIKENVQKAILQHGHLCAFE